MGNRTAETLPLEFTEPKPPRDAAARALARGVMRLLADAGQSCLCEFTLKNGRRADVIAVAEDGAFSIVEIKTGVADFRADHKWQDYIPFCDRFYFAVPEDFPQRLISESRMNGRLGLIVADAYGAVILREPTEDKLSGSRRRALTLRYAQTAGRRLMQILDPGCGL